MTCTRERMDAEAVAISDILRALRKIPTWRARERVLAYVAGHEYESNQAGVQRLFRKVMAMTEG